jgi:hypothetical protein
MGPLREEWMLYAALAEAISFELTSEDERERVVSVCLEYRGQ